MIIVVGSGLVAVTAAQCFLEHGHSVMLTTAHAEFGFPHGGCGLWDTTVLAWPLPTLEEAVAKQEAENITCRSQWLVKRLVHRFTDAGGRSATRIRIQRHDGVLQSTGTGAVPLLGVQHVFLADQDVTEPASSAGAPLLSHTRTCTWYGAITVGGTTVRSVNTGERGDGSIECWTTSSSELDEIRPFTLESMVMKWDEDDGPLNAARCARRSREAVHDLMSSNHLGVA